MIVRYSGKTMMVIQKIRARFRVLLGLCPLCSSGVNGCPLCAAVDGLPSVEKREKQLTYYSDLLNSVACTRRHIAQARRKTKED